MNVCCWPQGDLRGCRLHFRLQCQSSTPIEPQPGVQAVAALRPQSLALPDGQNTLHAGQGTGL